MTEIKRDFWRYLVQLPVQAESPKAAQDHQQMTFGYLQKWIFHSLSGQSVPVLTHIHSKKNDSLWPEICTNKVH